jgi:hypothetical protein
LQQKPPALPISAPFRERLREVLRFFCTCSIKSVVIAKPSLGTQRLREIGHLILTM